MMGSATMVFVGGAAAGHRVRVPAVRNDSELDLMIVERSGDTGCFSMPHRLEEDDFGEQEECSGPDDEEESGEPVDDDEESTVPCRYCKRPIYEDAPRCPHCEQYISDEDSPPARKPWWIIVGTVVCLYIVYRWVAG
jgi:hypothetical protein